MTTAAAVVWLGLVVLTLLVLDLADPPSALAFVTVLALFVGFNIDLVRRIRRSRRES